MAMNAGRSIHGVPPFARRQAERPRLSIDGDVLRVCELSPEDLARFPRRHVHEQVRDAANTNLPATNWSGISLRAIVDLATPGADARWIRIGAGPYATVVALADADAVLLCDRIDDGPLPVEHGGPWRLVRPDGRYYTSVKWVDRLTLTVDEPDNSAERIVRARQRARDAKA